MSILLEALKKSEEQRQLGATPTLQTPGAPLPARRGPAHRWVVATMAAAAVGVMTWMGWSQFRPPEPVDAPAGEVASLADSGPAARPAAADTEDVGTADVGTGGTDRGTADAALPRSTQPAEPQPAPPIPNVTAESSPLVSSGTRRERTAEEIAEKRRQLRKTIGTYAAPEAGGASGDSEALAGAPASEPAVPAVDDEMRQAEVVRDEVVQDEVVQNGAAVLAEESAAGMARARPAAPPDEDTISYWQIPTQTRQAMPELRIRVLVYADRPEDRFLLVNDQRLQEGEELESGLRLEEIRRDRAIFTYRDYRFHMKS